MEVNTQTMIFLYILVVVVQGGEVTLSVQSTAYPPYLYKDEPITITCTASGYNSIDYVTIINENTTSSPFYGCWNSDGWSVFGDVSSVPGFAEISNAFCEAIGAQSPPYILSLEGQVPDCKVVLLCDALVDGSLVYSDDILTISEIRVAPFGPPELNISGKEHDVVEGKEFTFACSSCGASPTSAYSYEVLRNGVIVAKTNTYTPVKEDRDGITLRCTDTVHYVALKDKYPEKVVKETDVKPRYLFKVTPEYSNLELNHATYNTLTCGVIGYPEEQIKYSWTCTGCTSNDTSQVLIIPESSRTSGQAETISCIAYLPTIPPIIIRWTVNWSSNSRTNSLSMKTELPVSIALIFLGASTVVLLVAVIVLSVVLWKHRRNDRNNGRVLNSRGREPPDQNCAHLQKPAAKPIAGRESITSGDGGDDYASLDTSRGEEHIYSDVGTENTHNYVNMEGFTGAGEK